MLFGCLFQMQQISDPESVFENARDEIALAAERPGSAGSARILVYTHSDQQLIRASVPLWLVRQICPRREDGSVDLVMTASEHGVQGPRVDPHLTLRDLQRFGRGASVDVEDASGDRVLVWLK